MDQRMTERERLIKLTHEALLDMIEKDIGDPIAQWEYIADYLLEHGVIVPPCKVGDTVYYIGGIRNTLVKSAVVEEIIANSCGVRDLLVNSENGVIFENSIDIFYFTREEAEAALAERRKS